MVDKEIIENLCISIRGYLKELMDAQNIERKKWSFLRDTQLKAGQVNRFKISLDQRKGRVNRQIDTQAARRPPTQIGPNFKLRISSVLIRGKQVRNELQWILLCLDVETMQFTKARYPVNSLGGTRPK